MIPARFQAAVCPRCDVILYDGVIYDECPACSLPVDWVDLRNEVWACPDCDHLRNDPVSSIEHEPSCPNCARPLVHLEALERPDDGTPTLLSRIRRAIFHPTVAGAVLVLASLPILTLAIDPVWKWLALALLGPFLVLPMVLGGLFLGAFAASFAEMRELVRDRRTRVIHGLEHATAKLLEKQGVPVFSGLTGAGSFYLVIDGRAKVDPKAVRGAARTAIDLVAHGHRDLVFHPRCGTSAAVAILFTALACVVFGMVGLFLHVEPETLLANYAVVLLVLVLGARRMGLLAQRLWTVSAEFEKARVPRVVREKSGDDDRFVVRVEVVLAKKK